MFLLSLTGSKLMADAENGNGSISGWMIFCLMYTSIQNARS
ncbi:hypothetical protein D3OALGB2SA_2633 [Olavius algarvensis associated proteobacterium Delta 3]|nr:hypothetical protein D3OALGB2SA_2633 [Olavius algarvensis associated proteobacterium Delta 3]